MFTGLIEEVGTVAAVRTTEDGSQLQIVAPRIAKQTKTGESIAVNGCCLTLRSRRAGNLTFDLLEETTARTNLKELRPRHRVNLERALRAEGRLGGHFVQGHVDCASAIVALDRKSADFRLEIELPGESENRLLDSHDRKSNRLGLFGGECPVFHSSDGLALEQFA